MSDPIRRWYPKTHADGDTHRGVADARGHVIADCDVVVIVATLLILVLLASVVV